MRDRKSYRGNKVGWHETAQIYVDMHAYKTGWFEPAPHLHGHKGIIRAGLSACHVERVCGWTDGLSSLWYSEKEKRKNNPLGGVAEEGEVLNLHNPFLRPAFESPVALHFPVSLPICSCQTTHVRKIGVLRREIPPDVSPVWKTRWRKKRGKKICKSFINVENPYRRYRRTSLRGIFPNFKCPYQLIEVWGSLVAVELPLRIKPSSFIDSRWERHIWLLGDRCMEWKRAPSNPLGPVK